MALNQVIILSPYFRGTRQELPEGGIEKSLADSSLIRLSIHQILNL